MRKDDSQMDRFRSWWEVAERWELTYLALMPVVVTLVFFQKRLGVPLHLRGLFFFLTLYCVGSFFVMLVVLDRRAEDQRRRRGSAKWRGLLDAAAGRVAAQHERKQALDRLQEAQRRGEHKAADIETP